MKLNYFQLWTIVASILIIILASVFFFLGDKISSAEKMNFIKEHTDSLFVTKYNPKSDSMAVMLSQSVDSSTNFKDTVTEKPNKPENVTNSAVITNPSVAKTQWYQRNNKYEDNESIDEDTEFESQDIYSLSNRETQATLTENNSEEKSAKPVAVSNLAQTSRPVAGTKAFNDYVQKNRKPITDKDCANQHGKVILLFKVDTGGHPVDIAIFRSLCHAADKEAVRLLQNGPDWTKSDRFTRWEITF